MKFFAATPLVSLVFCLGALGASVQMRGTSKSTSNIPNSGLDRCPTAEVVSTQIIQAGSISVNRTTYSCPDSSLRESLQSPPANAKQLPKSAFGQKKRDASAQFDGTGLSRMFAQRNAAECRNPAPECQCGTDFQCSCQNITATAPASSDCQSLISSLSVVAQATGATFLVEPDNFELLSFATCAIEWTNLGCETLEYCWDEFGDTAGVVNQLCFEQGGGTAASCPSDDDLWLFQALSVQ